MKMRPFLLLLVFLALLSCSNEEEKIVARKATQELIANVKNWMDRVVSYDTKKIAYTVNTGNILQPCQVLYINDNQIYTAEHITNLLFSFDSTHIAFVARKDNRAVVLVDGKVIKEYDDIGAKSLLFSPDSSRMAYNAKTPKGWLVAIYNINYNKCIESQAYDNVGSKAVFSPDSKRVAYSAKQSGKWKVILDGEEHKEYDDIGRRSFTFSPDNKHFVYGSRIGSRWVVVQDSKESEPYDGIIEDSLLYSPDGQHFAYAVGDSGKQYVIVDGNSQKRFKKIASKTLTFSPDGKRLGYVAYDRDGWFVVVNGKKDKKHELLYSGPIFSSNGEKYAYVAGEKRLFGAKMYVLREGKKEGKRYDGILSETLSFSPNSNSIAYVARRGGLIGGKYFLVVNAGEGGDYDEVMSLDFQNLGVTSLFQFRRYYFIKNRQDPWDNDTEVSYLAREKENVYLVKERVVTN